LRFCFQKYNFYIYIFFIITSSADSPRDSVQFIEWSPTSYPRALLIANFHGRVTIWTQPSQVSMSYQSHYLAPNELPISFLFNVAYISHLCLCYTPLIVSSFRGQLILFVMLAVGGVSMSGVKILQLLRSGYQECLRYATTQSCADVMLKYFLYFFWWSLVNIIICPSFTLNFCGYSQIVFFTV
jgi:hypothetical protein